MASKPHQLVSLPALAGQFISSPTRVHRSRTLVVPNANVVANSSRVGTIRLVGRPINSFGSHRAHFGATLLACADELIESDLSLTSSCRSHDLQILCRCFALVGYFFVLNSLPFIESA